MVIDFRWKIIQKLPEKWARGKLYTVERWQSSPSVQTTYILKRTAPALVLSHMALMQCSDWKFILWNHVWLLFFFSFGMFHLTWKKSEEKKKQSKWLHNGHFHGHTELCVLHFSYRKMANIHQHIPPTTIYIYFTCNFMITMSFAINSFNVRFFRAVLLIFLFQLDTVVVVYGVSEHFCGMHITETI